MTPAERVAAALAEVPPAAHIEAVRALLGTTGAADQIREALELQLWGLSAVVGRLDPADVVRWDLTADADRLAAQLDSGDDRLAARTAVDLAAAGVIPDDPDAEWWASPLGRVVARNVGHPSLDVVTRAEAARMLGVTPQRVSSLCRDGWLETVDGGVTVASVRARLWDPPGPGRPRA